MPHSLLPLRRLGAAVLVAAVGFGSVAFAAPGIVAPASTQSVAPLSVHELNAPVSLEVQPKASPELLAHHEATVGATQLLTANATSIAGMVSKSLWGNMVLTMAIQQDDEVQRINKKLGRMSGIVFASVGMISALGVAQGIDGLATLQQDPHPLHPPIMGLVGSSLTLVSVASQAAMIHHYKKQLVVRQEQLADQVSHVLEHLKNDGLNDSVHSELSGLIGAQGAEEFLGLWQAAHPH